MFIVELYIRKRCGGGGGGGVRMGEMGRGFIEK